MSPKSIVSIAIVVILAVVGLGVLSKSVGIIDSQEWIFVQPYWGEAKIQNGSGVYWKGLADTWAYPRYMELVYSDESGEGEKEKESIRVTFNDGSTAQISTFIVVETPSSPEDQIAFHKKMNGSPMAIKSKTKAYLTECLKSTAPLMSSTEHQVSRKSDFSQKVEEQLSNGVYQMKQVQKELVDRVDAEGNPVTVQATEMVVDENGVAVIAKKSPLIVDYKMTITQFNVKKTDYDPDTLKQFSAKKEQFLAAEQSKAEREAMVQEALKIEAEGLKDKAQAEAEANVLMATAVIAATQKANVAEQAKVEAETVAGMKLSVAKIEQEEAQVKLDIADLDAQAVVLLAEAEQKKIALAGAITELEQAEIDANVEIMKEFAKSLPLMAVPSTVIGGGSGGGAEGSNIMTDSMMPLLMFKMIAGDNLADFGKMKTTDSADRRINQRNAVSQEVVESVPVAAQ